MSTTGRLSDFGAEFIKNVRTSTIEHFNAVITGKMKSPAAQDLGKDLSIFGSQELDVIKKLVTIVVDETLFKTLFMFEEGDYTVIEKEAVNAINIKGLDAISDGLSGELYGKKGWIELYS